MRKRIFWLVIPLLMVVATVCFTHLAGASTFVPLTDQEALPTLLDGCRNAVASVHSGQGKVAYYRWFQSPAGDIIETETAYQVTFSGDKFRLSVDEKYLKNLPTAPPPSEFMLFAPGTVRSRQVAYDGTKVTRYEPAKNAATIADIGSSAGRWGLQDYQGRVAFLGNGLLEPDKWFWMGPPRFTRTAPKIVGRETVNGDDCYVLEVVFARATDPASHPVLTYWYWVDPNKGFTVVRRQSWVEGGPLYEQKALFSEQEVELRQYADGVWGPARVTHTEYSQIADSSGQHLKNFTSIATYDPDFLVNVAVDDAALRLALPSGTEVTDDSLQETYVAP